MSQSAADDERPRPGLGTFGGVFTPSILTILGIILFLRLGFVVGNSGLLRALIIVGLANAVSVLTSTSLAAVATNIRVKGGGDYYLISRTLGMEFGGPLGLVLYLAQSVSIAFYAIGFAEALSSILGGGPEWMPQVIALGAVAVLFVFAWIGADAATKLQFLIMVALAAALLAIFGGTLRGFDSTLLAQSWEPSGDLPFWAVFAIFFPAVTGFTQGVAMSGDLADPTRSITRGTFAAVFISAAIYIALCVLLAGSVPGQTLATDYGALRGAALWPWLVDVGVVAATLSSALASMLGAPRILQSLAADKIFPGLSPFAVGAGPSNNPRRGLLLSMVIAVLTIGLGNLNVIAPVVSMFFLISYGLLNYATYAEARGNSPSFRPRFRWYDRRLSLLGCLLCLSAMVAIHPTAGAGALIILFGLHQYLSNRPGSARWADSSRGHRLASVRQQLLEARSDVEHARDWRPVILAFSDDPARRERLLRFASWIEAGTGFTTVVRLIAGDDLKARRARREAEAELRAEITRWELDAFPLALALPDLDAGFPALLQGHGLGPVRANLVLLNWFDGEVHVDDARLRTYGRPLRTAVRLQRNVVILEATTDEMAGLEALAPAELRIDAWFRDDATGRLTLLLAHLATRHEHWEDASLRVLAPLPAGADEAELREQLTHTLDESRIEAQLELVPAADHAALVRLSADAALVFLPFRMQGEVPVCSFSDDLEQLLDELPVVALVMAGQDIDLEAEPESGVYAERAQAQDEAEQRSKRSEQAGKEAERAAQAAQKAKEKLASARSEGAPDETVEELSLSAEAQAAAAEDLRRRALKALAKAQTAERDAADPRSEPATPLPTKDAPDEPPKPDA